MALCLAVSACAYHVTIEQVGDNFWKATLSEPFLGEPDPRAQMELRSSAHKQCESMGKHFHQINDGHTTTTGGVSYTTIVQFTCL